MTDDRRSYIGGPGAATILGLNQFKTPLALWQELTGRSEQQAINDAMRSGLRLERAVLDYAAEELNQPVMAGPFLRDPKLPLGGHLDGVTESGDVVEAKTARSKRDWGEPGTDSIPLSYVVQCQHYLGLMPSAPVAWVPVLFSGLDFALYRVERDDATINAMREICVEWWNVHIIGDTPPPPVNGADALRLFPRDTGATVIADDAVAEAVEKLRAARQQIKELEEARDALEDRIKSAMGGAATLTVNGEVAVTWRAGKPAMRFDATAFKTAQPQVYAEFCRPVESRRFLVK
jgi:putative phage-type endonuclease